MSKQKNVTFVQNLKYLVEKTGVSQAENARTMGVNAKTLSAWMTGQYMPKQNDVRLLSRHFHVTEHELLNDNLLSKSLTESSNEKPFVRSNNNEGISAVEEIYIDVSDNSMADVGIHAGDRAYFVKKDAINGDIVVAAFKGALLIRRLYRFPEKEMLLLIPENRKIPETVLYGDKTNDVTIIGIVTAVRRNI